MPHELSPADSLVPMVTQRADVPHLTTAHAGRALLCVCAASARLGIFGELGDPSRGSVTPASETRPAGRLGVCRAERIRRRLGLRRSMLSCGRPPRRCSDETPGDELQQPYGRGRRLGGQYPGDERSGGLTPAALQVRDEFEGRCSVPVRFSTGARLTDREGWLTTERAKGRAPGRAGSAKLGQTGGNTSSRHRMGHVELPDPGHKLRGVSVTSIYAHARQPFVFGRVSGDHFNARKTAQNREFPAAALPVGPAPGPVMGGRAAEPASRGSG